MVVSRPYGPRRSTPKRSKQTGFQGEFDPFSDFFEETFNDDGPPPRPSRVILVNRGGGQRPPQIQTWKAPKFIRIVLFWLAPLIAWVIGGLLLGAALWMVIEATFRG